jgi:parvulin-like peptidyl-prolyl isomerase
MSKSGNCFIYTLACWCCMGVLLFAGGCQSGKGKRGKFSEEEMAAFGLAERENLPEPSGGLVLSVHKETITVDEIISPLIESLEPMATSGDFQKFERQAKPIITRVILNKTTDILIYQQAKKQAAGNIDEAALEKAVESEVNRFVTNYGGNLAEANKAIKEMGLDWPRFRDYQKKLLLTQSYLSQKLSEDKPVGHSELLTYYEAMKDEYFQRTGQIQFRLIDIATDKVEPAESGEGRAKSAKEAALKLTEELLEKIEQGEDFGELAKKYSNEAPHRVQNGGLWTPVTTGSLAAPHDELEKEAQKMQVGQVSGPIEADGHIFIMKLEDKREGHFEAFEDVQQRIEAEILFQRRKERFDEMISNLIRQANIADMDGFINFCVGRAYQRCRMGG